MALSPENDRWNKMALSLGEKERLFLEEATKDEVFTIPQARFLFKKLLELERDQDRKHTRWNE